VSKEWILNHAMNRFQFNYKRNVGAVSEEIRKCSPLSVNDWEYYYFKNVKPKEHLEDLGRKLFIKITEVIDSEIESITEKDCIDYVLNLVINRTYDGYQTEIRTIYGVLQQVLGVPIVAASDEWDRKYNVDFFIEINNNFIGLQIKPVNNTAQISQIYKEREIQHQTHKDFFKKFGGRVFYIFSQKVADKKVIQNKEVIDEIKSEILRLRNTSKYSNP